MFAKVAKFRQIWSHWARKQSSKLKQFRDCIFLLRAHKNWAHYFPYFLVTMKCFVIFVIKNILGFVNCRLWLSVCFRLGGIDSQLMSKTVSQRFQTSPYNSSLSQMLNRFCILNREVLPILYSLDGNIIVNAISNQEIGQPFSLFSSTIFYWKIVVFSGNRTRFSKWKARTLTTRPPPPRPI